MQSEKQPPSSDRSWQGVTLSVLVHAGLLAVLLWGFRWQTPAPTVTSAELWSSPPLASPPPAEVAPSPPPPPPPPPRPVEPAVQAKPVNPQPDADIALEKARKAKEEQEKKRELERKALEERERKDKLEKQEKAAKAAKAAKAEQAEKAEKAEKAAKAERDAKARLEAERREQAATEKALARQREENLARMMGQLGTPNTGSAAKAGSGTPSAGGGGPSASYAGRLIQAIRPNIVFAETPANNPAAEVEVRTGPSGTIIGRTLVRSSGIPEWDNAVLRAIDRTGTLPQDTDGRVPPRLTITFRPRD